MIDARRKAEFAAAIGLMADAVQNNSAAHGFWADGLNRNKGEMLALIHSEVSECLEAVRKPHKDKHCPTFDNEAIKLADIIIRVMDYARGFDLPLAHAILAKHEFNEGRPKLHGKKF